MGLMPYLFVKFVIFLVFIKRKCHICDIIIFNRLTLTQSKCISGNVKSFYQMDYHVVIRPLPSITLGNQPL